MVGKGEGMNFQIVSLSKWFSLLERRGRNEITKRIYIKEEQMVGVRGRSSLNREDKVLEYLI